MAELIAEGKGVDQHRRLPLVAGTVVRMGRAPRTGWKIPWDRKISREHAEIEWQDDTLTVRRLEAARNPIWFRGDSQNEFTATIGEQFQIGDTVFRIGAVEPSRTSDVLIAEHAYNPDDLRDYRFSDADQRMEDLARLPALVQQGTDDKTLASEIAKILLQAIPKADAAAVVVYKEQDAQSEGFDWTAEFQEAESSGRILMRFDQRGESNERFKPSRRLIRDALTRGEVVLHIWDQQSSQGDDFTMVGNLDWAFCTPVDGEATRGWCLYVTGRFRAGGESDAAGSPVELLRDLRFACLLAQFVAISRQARLLEEQQAMLSSFFSPAVIEAIRSKSAEKLLMPNEGDISVLFCDVRGFSKKTEVGQENLMGLLHRVSRALSVMTRGIVKYEGIVADFQGDAAMGFWGWPTAAAEGPLWACRAALAIHARFSEASRTSTRDDATVNVLSDFRVGIGIAHGRAVAGKIGADEHAKVGVFGPVVNLGSRLEGLTKTLRVPILIDEPTADFVRQNMSPNDGRCRKLARLIPYGMTTPITVFELLPPAGPNHPITDANLAEYEAAVDAFIEGRWQDALDHLDRLPVGDRAKDFLMIYIAQNDYEPPAGWDGVITMSNK